ncbi:MAG TPA: kinase [Caulobacteraceae bacterium]|nr:kinase [Caulobacteraceae bacterium]
MNPEVALLMAEHVLPFAYAEIVETVHRPLAARLVQIHAAHGRPIVVGVSGSQASGKTTLCAFLELLLGEAGLKVQTLSIDNLYLSKPRRQALAGHTHPLLVTRGPPGTHDIPLGHAVLDLLTGARPSPVRRMPRFDKAADTLAPEREWPPLAGPVDVVMFEGWCVGARPQPQAALLEPVNALERDEDPQAVWRAYVNTHLANDYAGLFARIDALVMLKAPDFDAVFAWRALQEKKLGDRLRATGALTGGRKLMSDADLRRFLAHYQRLTEWILEEMPARADVLVELGRGHEVVGMRV